jgi:hypothetical protein
MGSLRQLLNGTIKSKQIEKISNMLGATGATLPARLFVHAPLTIEINTSADMKRREPFDALMIEVLRAPFFAYNNF